MTLRSLLVPALLSFAVGCIDEELSSTESALETPDFLIDSGRDIQPPFNTYGITTSGQGDWHVGWQGDGMHRFTGDVYAPVGCELGAIFTNGRPGDIVTTIAANHVGFDVTTDASVRQTLQLFTPTSDCVPLTFDLAIDGAPATNPFVVFSSFGELATPDTMPFDLVPDTAAF